jgi:hypothetical protein
MDRTMHPVSAPLTCAVHAVQKDQMTMLRMMVTELTR